MAHHRHLEPRLREVSERRQRLEGSAHPLVASAPPLQPERSEPLQLPQASARQQEGSELQPRGRLVPQPLERLPQEGSEQRDLARRGRQVSELQPVALAHQQRVLEQLRPP